MRISRKRAEEFLQMLEERGPKVQYMIKGPGPHGPEKRYFVLDLFKIAYRNRVEEIEKRDKLIEELLTILAAPKVEDHPEANRRALQVLFRGREQMRHEEEHDEL